MVARTRGENERRAGEGVAVARETKGEHGTLLGWMRRCIEVRASMRV